MSFRNRHLVAAITSILFGCLMFFAVPVIAEAESPVIQLTSTVLGALLILHGMLMGAWGLYHERMRKKEIAAVRAVYPQLADIPFDLFKKHYLFIWYFQNTPDPLPVRLHVTEDDVELSERKRIELASFDRLLAAHKEMDVEQKRMCRMRFILEELLNLTPRSEQVSHKQCLNNCNYSAALI